MYEISSIFINHLKNPVGITGPISVGWVLESDRNDVYQENYQIQIAEDASFQHVLYDTRSVWSEESANIEVPYSKWKSLTRYYVRCRSWSRDNEFSHWAKTFFTTGVCQTREFRGSFITAETKEDAAISKGTILEKTFELKDKPVSQILAVSTALGLYELYVNGQKAAEDVLKPGWTSYGKRLLYQIHDITSYVRGTKLTVAGMLGAGWYKGKMGFLLERNIYGDRTAFYCMVQVLYEDGERQILSTDETWTGKDAPVTFAEIYDGEVYDTTVNFDDVMRPETALTRAIEYPFSKLVPQQGGGIRKHETFEPIEEIHTPKGERVLDFGQNMAGWASFTGSGAYGDVVTLQFFETLDTDGNVYTENLRTAKQQFSVVLDGSKPTVFEPHFTYMGFRYVQIITSGASCRVENVRAHAIYSDMKPAGTFLCSDERINQLHSNILWSMKGNFTGVPTDCPQRDERCGWTGDAQIFSKTAAYLMDVYTFFDNWLADVAEDQTSEGGVPHVVPDILTNAKDNTNWLVAEGTHSASAWADAVTIIPWLLYEQYGDEEVLRTRYDSMKKWIDFMTRHAKGGIFDYAVQLGDWLALDAEEGSYYGATPNDYVCSVYYIYSTQLLAKTAAVLKKETDAAHYAALADELLEAYERHYVREDGMLCIDTQTAYILALHFHLLPGNSDSNQKAAAHLAELIRQNGGHLSTGFVGTPYICYALSSNGQKEAAYDLLLKDTFPSWLYEVKEGATTIWEHWDGKKPDGTMWSADMNSFNHYAYGAIGEWLYRQCAGIQADEHKPGFQNWIIRPCIGGFQWVQASYESSYGTGKVSWKRMEEAVMTSILLEIDIPVNTTADIILDDCVQVLSTENVVMEETSWHTYTGHAKSGKCVICYQLVGDMNMFTSVE